jgi:hypothetical protein
MPDISQMSASFRSWMSAYRRLGQTTTVTVEAPDLTVSLLTLSKGSFGEAYLAARLVDVVDGLDGPQVVHSGVCASGIDHTALDYTHQHQSR